MKVFSKCSFLCISIFLFYGGILKAQHISQTDSETYNKAVSLYEKGLFAESVKYFEEFKRQNILHELKSSADFYLTRALAATDSSNIESFYFDYVQRYPSSHFSVILLKDLAKRMVESGNFDEAILYYQQAIKNGMSPSDEAETKYLIAEAAASNNDLEASISYFMEVADEHRNSEWAPKALYARGRLFLEQEEFDASSEAFELLKERYPNNPVTRRVGTALGESYYIQERYNEAVTALEGALPHLDRESRIKAVFLIAESLNYMNNFEEASKYYLQYINLTKNTPQERIAHYGLGWLYHKQEIYHWASESFGRAATGDDETARKAQYYKAVNEKLSGQFAESLASFREFGDRYKSGLWVETAYYEWAVSAFEAGFYNEAIEVLLSLIRNQEELDDPGKIFTLLGEAYYANAEYTRAIQAFEEAEKTADISPELKRQATFQKAWTLLRNQAYEQAQPLFEQVYREAPNSELGGEALFWSADSYYRMGQFSNAAKRFSIFVENYSESELIGAARYSLGWSYFQLGQFDKAVGPLENFLADYNPPPIALYPYDVDTKLRIGDAYYALGEYRNAIESYNKAIGAEPGGDYAMFQVANSYYRMGRTFDAVSTFRRMLRIYPFSRMREQAQYNIAYIYLNTNNFAQAIEEFQTVINKYPGTEWAARSQYNIGDAYYNAGEFDQAVEAYKRVLENYPRSHYIIEAINGIQYAQLSSGGEDSSSVILEEFLRENPSSRTADVLRYRKAYNVFQTGDYENAIREFRQYLRVTNSDDRVPETYLNLGESYRQLGQLQNAINAYHEIVNNYPDDELAASALITLGNIFYEQGNYAESHSNYEQLLDLFPRYRTEAYVGMGNASLALDELSKAEDEFRAALNSNANNEAAKVGLAKVAIENSSYEEAEDLLAPIAERNTTEVGAEAQYYLGYIYQLQENWNAAIEAYSKISVLYGSFDQWVSRALFRSAQCHIRLGNRGEAMSILNNLVQNYQGTQAAEDAAELLEREDL